MKDYTQNKVCRICGSRNLFKFLDLGKQPPANAFVTENQIKDEKTYPLAVYFCENCGLVQLIDIVSPEILFKDYSYFTGKSSETMKQHFKELAESLTKDFDLKKDDLVVDIGCLPEGNVISEGFVPLDIKSISENTNVLGVGGEFVRVTKKFVRCFEGDLIKIKIRGSNKSIRLTPNHLVLIIKKPPSCTLKKEELQQYIFNETPRWIPANELCIGDYCIQPKIRLDLKGIPLDLSKEVDCLKDERLIYAKQKNKKGWVEKAHNQNPLKRFVDLDFELGELLGYYISEGSGDGKNANSFAFALSLSEKFYAQNIEKTLLHCLGLKSSIRKDYKRKYLQVRCCSSLGKKLFQLWCGNHAKNKHLPLWVWSSTYNFIYGLLVGLFNGDGSILKDYIKYDTISKTLAYQIKFLLSSLGIQSSIVMCKPNGYGKNSGNSLFSLRIFSKESITIISKILNAEFISRTNITNNKYPSLNNFLLIRINEISQEYYKGNVYNIETEDNSYLTESIIVHNSNDGTLLNNFKTKVLGIDPSENVTEESCRKGIDTMNTMFTANSAFTALNSFGKAKVITATNVLAHVNNLYDFMTGVKCLLDEYGVFVVEVPYFLEQYENCDWTQFYHEHLSYFLTKPLVILMKKFGLNLTYLKEIPVHGGSIRCCFTEKCLLTNYNEHMLRREDLMGLYNKNTYGDFSRNITENHTKLSRLIDCLRADGKKIAGYGAPAKGNTLLNACQIGTKYLDYILDTTPYKQGKFSPGMHIPIVSPEYAKENPPDYFLMLPWNYETEILNKEKEYIAKGGKFIVPIPEPRVIP